MAKRVDEKGKNLEKNDYCDVITHQMTSYIIKFILKTFQLPCNEDLLRLICENISSYITKVKQSLRVKIGASEKSTDISKIQGQKNFFFMYLRPIKF